MLRGNLLRVPRSASSLPGALPRQGSHSIVKRVGLSASSSTSPSTLPSTRSLSSSSSLSRMFSSSSSSSIRPFSAYPHQRINQSRWQSTQTEKNDENSATNTTTTGGETEASKDDASKQELEQKNKEIVDLKDKYLRSVADYRNLQDRTKRDMDGAKQFAIQRFATDLLDSIDNLDRALESVPKEALESSSSSSSAPNKDLVNLYSGIKMTSEILLTMMQKHGLQRFDPLEREGRKFNPQTDEATFFTKVEGKEDGEVFYTQSKGFTLNGRVVRAAKVGVVKNT